MFFPGRGFRTSTRRVWIFLTLPLIFLILASERLQAQMQPAQMPSQVDGAQISTLVRTTLVALHQANVTGNYTVFRDLSARSIRDNNNPSQLAETFKPIRESRLDLSKTVIFDPMLHQRPVLTQNGTLQIVGRFPTRPEAIYFDLVFLFEAGHWRIARVLLDSKPSIGAKPSVAGYRPKPKPRPDTQNPQTTQTEEFEW